MTDTDTNGRPVRLTYRTALMGILLAGILEHTAFGCSASGALAETQRLVRQHDAEMRATFAERAKEHTDIRDSVDRLAYAMVAPADEVIALRKALAQRPAVAKLLRDIEADRRDIELERRKGQVRQRNGLSAWPSGKVEMPPKPDAP